MAARDAATATRRFGLGARPGELKRLTADPRGAVLDSISDRNGGVRARPGLEPSHTIFAAAQEAQMAQALAQALAKDGAAKMAAPAKPGPTPPAPNSDKAMLPPDMRPAAIRRDILLEEQHARVEHAVATERVLVERLVMFWSNHFCVSALKGPVRGIAGSFEREAIRPHVLGRFADMLKAVEQHPAMLIYLDNHISIGPASQAGRNRSRGLNENLAREILELHSLGVDGGYTQADVMSLARILTGWTVGNMRDERDRVGRFMFAPNRHEPGLHTVLGKRYGEQGMAAGEMVLADLARHPSTARHIAAKLARHFVSDRAPASLIARLERAFRESDGDLQVVTRALVTAPEAWELPPTKVVPPYDFVVALARGLRLNTKPGELVRLAGLLGQPLWQVPAPKGWPDTDDAWMGPSAVRERLRIAEKAAREVAADVDPRALAEDLLGPALSAATRQAIARAETREQGFELLVMAPEMIRR